MSDAKSNWKRLNESLSGLERVGTRIKAGEREITQRRSEAVSELAGALRQVRDELAYWQADMIAEVGEHPRGNGPKAAVTRANLALDNYERWFGSKRIFEETE